MRVISASLLVLSLVPGLALAQDGAGSATTQPTTIGEVQPGTLLWADDAPPKPSGKRWHLLPFRAAEQPATAEPKKSAPAAAPSPKSPVVPVAAETSPAADSKPSSAAKTTGPAAPLPECVFCTQACSEGECCPKTKPEIPQPCGCWWISADYMLRWLKPTPVPGPLLVVGGAPGTPGATTLGNTSNFTNSSPFNGIQVTTGVQVPDGPFGIEFGGFLLEQQTSNVNVSSNAAGSPLIAFPFVGTNPPGPDKVLLASPGAFAGGATLSNTARLFGGEANLARCALCCKYLRGDWLAGFRYLNLSEAIGIAGSSVDIPPTGIPTLNGVILPANTPVLVADRFSTLNNFYGGQIGGRLEWHYGAFYLLTTGKIAFGLSDQIVSVGGASAAFPAGAAPISALGGVYAQPSNIGRANHPEFAVVPEIGMTFGVQLTQRLRMYVGYNFLYWSNVVRPGSQINPSINQAQIPLSGAFAPVTQPVQPLQMFRSTDLWVQGIDVGLAFHF